MDTNEIQGWIAGCTDERYLRVLIKAATDRITELGADPKRPLDRPDGSPTGAPYKRTFDAEGRVVRRST